MEKARVVVVAEDDPLLRLHATTMLEDEGFQVLAAKDAASALRMLETRADVDVLFTDIQMPGAMDGMALAELVHQRWPNVLLVVTSGRLRPQQKYLPDDGRFVPKPYMPEDILAQIRDLIAKYR